MIFARGNVVPNSETGVDKIILIPGKFEFLFHPGDIGIREVGSVEVIHEIH
jgi:hypothetical protein